MCNLFEKKDIVCTAVAIVRDQSNSLKLKNIINIWCTDAL